tara:strand:+ start:1590 stop:4370 length:2781 start_codon:yes stop_codon:yes gene_type:complete
MSLRIPQWVWLMCLACLMGLGLWIWSPKRQASGLTHWLPQKLAQQVNAFSTLSRDFGLGRLVVLGFRVPEGEDIFYPRWLGANKSLTQRLLETKGVVGVVSLAGVPSIQRKGKKLDVSLSIPNDLVHFSKQAQQALRERMLRDPLMKGGVFSPDGRIALFVCLLKDSKTPGKMVNAIMEHFDALRKKYTKLTFFADGLPTVQTMLPFEMLGELGRIGGWGILFLLFVWVGLWRSFDSVMWSVALAAVGGLSGMILCIWLFGGWSDEFLFLPLFAFCASTWWGSFLAKGTRGRVSFVGESGRVYLRAWGAACLVVSLSLGGMAFLDFPVLQRLGVGLALTMLLVALLGAVLLLPGMSSTSSLGTLKDTPERRIFLLGTKGRLILSILMMVCLTGLFTLSPGRELHDFFPRQTPLYLGGQLQVRHLGGSQPFFIRFRGDLKDPVWLKVMARLTQKLKLEKRISHPQSLAHIMLRLHYLFGSLPRIGDERQLIVSLFMMVDGQAILKSLIRNNVRDGIIQARISLSSTAYNETFSKRVNEYIRSMPTRYHKVDMRKLSAAKRQALVRWRVHWIVDGLRDWWRLSTKRQLSKAQEAKLQTLLTQLLRLRLKKSPPVRIGKTLVEPLKAFVASEDFDLELTAPEQKKATRALLALDASGTPLAKEAIQRALLEALKGSKAASDKEGMKYALKSLDALFRRLYRGVVRDRLQGKCLQVLLSSKRIVSSRQKTFVWRDNQKGTSHTLDLRELGGHLSEVFNPHWIEVGKGPHKLRIEQVGLHSLFEALHRRVWPYFVSIGFLIWIGLFVVGGWLVKKPSVAFLGTLMGLFAVASLLGVMSWMNIPFDWPLSLLVLWMFAFFAFPFFLLLSQETCSEGMWWGLSRRVLSVIFLVCPLFFASIPMLRHIGFVFGMGSVLFWVALFIFFAEKRETA